MHSATTRITVRPSLAGRLACAVVERTQAAGACTFTDLRRAGFSRRQILGHMDAAREIIAETHPGLAETCAR